MLPAGWQSAKPDYETDQAKYKAHTKTHAATR
jgi:hypothetical protein